MSGERRCPHCGVELATAASPEGLCPRCMLRLGFGGGGEEGDATELSPTASESSAGAGRPDWIGPYKILDTPASTGTPEVIRLGYSARG